MDDDDGQTLVLAQTASDVVVKDVGFVASKLEEESAAAGRQQEAMNLEETVKGKEEEKEEEEETAKAAPSKEQEEVPERQKLETAARVKEEEEKQMSEAPEALQQQHLTTLDPRKEEEAVHRDEGELGKEAPSYHQNEKKRVQALLQDERQKKKPSSSSSSSSKRRGGHGSNDERKKDEEEEEEEDVCYICFDGGDLVMCDRKSCPKAYHLNCIGRDAAFFKKKGAWICGWHFCSACTKPGSFQCYMCPIAYCGGCVKDAGFVRVRKRKGLCEECLPIVIMIERNQNVNSEGVEVNFDDKETYEYMFKEYWLGLKNRLLLTMPELDEKGKPMKGNHGAAAEEDGRSDTENQDPSDVDDRGVDDEYDQDGVNDLDWGKGSRKKIKVSPENLVMENKAVAFSEGGEEKEEEENAYEQEEDVNDDDDDYYDDDMAVEVPPSRKIEGWASKEVLDFIIHMNGDPVKPLTKFAVHRLLRSYIKQHQLEDPTKKTQITCDERLQVIFGKKKSMGLPEMYKQLKEHFPRKNPPVSAATKSFKEADRTAKDNTHEGDSGAADKFDRDPAKDKWRGQRRSEEKFERPDRNDFAAITPKNIDQIYLRRALLEHLLDDAEFERKVVDTFVRIRVPGNASTSETCYRLVLVTGTRQQSEAYRAGKKLTNFVLEILNLQRKEDLTIDLVSNQDFSEEECQRLQQSIKCGFIKRLTVGQVEAKAIDLQEAKFIDWLETERQRLVNLRDRASEKGRKKEYPTTQCSFLTIFFCLLTACVEKLEELNNPTIRAAKLQARPEVSADPHMRPGYESDEKPYWNGERGEGRSWTKDQRDYLQEPQSDADDWRAAGRSRSDHWSGDRTGSRFAKDEFQTPVFDQTKSYQGGGLQRERVGPASTLPPLSNIGVTFPEARVLNPAASADIIENEKVWHYKDPTGTIQGPFSMEQLRKWNTTGLFPIDLRIARTGQTMDDSILLTNALAGRFTEERDSWRDNMTSDDSGPAVSGAAVDAFAERLKGEIGGSTAYDLATAAGNGSLRPLTSQAPNLSSSVPLATGSSTPTGSGQQVTWDQLTKHQQQLYLQRKEMLQRQQQQQQQLLAASQASKKSGGISQGISFGALMPLLQAHLPPEQNQQLNSLYQKFKQSEITREDFVRGARVIVGDQVLTTAAKPIQLSAEQLSASRPPAQPLQAASLQQQQKEQEELMQMASHTHQQSIQQPHQQPKLEVQPHTSLQSNQTKPPLPLPPQQSKPSDQAQLTADSTEYPDQHVTPSMLSQQAKHEVEKPLVTTQPARPHVPLQQPQITPSPSPFGSFQPRPPLITPQTVGPVAHPSQSPVQRVSTLPQFSAMPAQSLAAQLKPGVSSPTSDSSLQPEKPLSKYAKQKLRKEQKRHSYSSFLLFFDQVSQQPHTGPVSVPTTPPSLVNSASVLGSGVGTTQTPSTGGVVPVQGQNSMHQQGLATAPVSQPLSAAVKTPPKVLPLAGQKKPAEPMPQASQPASKKQKLQGGEADQSIDQLNDVTAVSGVNLREEEEQLLAGPKEESRTTAAMRKFVQEEEERLFLEKGPLRTKAQAIAAKCGIKSVSEDVERCLSMCVEERLRSMLYKLIKLSKQRCDLEKDMHKVVVTSDPRRQVLLMKKRSKEASEKKLAEENERLRKLNEKKDKGPLADAENEDLRAKVQKAQQEEEDKMRANAANVAARAAVGADDMLTKWQLLAAEGLAKRQGGGATTNEATRARTVDETSVSREQNRQQDEGGIRSGSGPGRPGTEQEGGAPAVAAIPGRAPGSGLGIHRTSSLRQPGTVQAGRPQRSIMVKDVIAFLEREPQMSKSKLLYRLYEREQKS
ncbi:unnamed protein product [Sphagnum balticum]